MARIKRSLQVHKDMSVHKIWRGHNQEWNLSSAQDKSTYLRYMNEDLESDREAGSIPQALTLMSNHTHEVSLVLNQKLFSDHMRRHHARYGIYFNNKNDRSGKVAEDRPHTTLLADGHHEMIAVFYVHANPVRAKIVKDANQYVWSTHRLYAAGKVSPWMKNIKLPNWYLQLGKTQEDRQRAYRRLFARYLREEGMEKKPYFSRCFFGPIEWKQKMEDVVRKWRKESRSPP